MLYGERVYEVFSSGWRAFRKFVYILFCRNDNKPHRFDVCRKILKSIKVKNKNTNTKEAFLNFAPYNEFIEASENSPFIKTLNEVNNVYRTIIAVFIAIIVVKLYDWLFYDFINNIGVLGNNLIFIIICLLIVLLFSQSYKKQTDYIRRRVKKYTNSKQV